MCHPYRLIKNLEQTTAAVATLLTEEYSSYGEPPMRRHYVVAAVLLSSLLCQNSSSAISSEGKLGDNLCLGDINQNTIHQQPNLDGCTGGGGPAGTISRGKSKMKRASSRRDGAVNRV